MLKLTRHLFLSDPSAKYMDYYERTLYNHILSSQHPAGGFVYFTPMRPGHYRVYSQPQEGFWCCVGSGLENHGKYGELIYAHTDKDLFVNLFMASSLEWKEKGLKIIQHTDFPDSEHSGFEVKLDRPAEFSIHFRYPSWVEEGKMKINVNGKEEPVVKDLSAYVRINRKWQSGDRITVTLPMHTTAEFLPDNSDWVSFLHGPIVLAAATSKSAMQGLKADGSRMGHIASGPLMPLDEAPLIVARKETLTKGIIADKTDVLGFMAADLIYQKKYKDLHLVPFYKLYDTRYVIYWPYTNPDNLQSLLDAMKKKEEAAVILEALTIDLVNTGEQQPESDHQFKGEGTDTGLFLERHFRTGNGWFSYNLKDTAEKANKIRITYYGAEKNKNFDVLINNVLLKTVTLDGTKGEEFFEEEYQLPENLRDKNLVLKFVGRPNASIANIFEVRLMK